MFRSILSSLWALAWIAGIAIVAAPFFVSSLALDNSTSTVPARVDSKSETLRVTGGSWSRTPAVVFRYQPPDSRAPQFLRANVSTEEYDAYHPGDPVTLRYLPAADVPSLPLAGFLRQAHFLPEARLPDRRTFSAIRDFASDKFNWLEIVAMTVVFLVFLRVIKSPAFPWATGAAVLAGFAALAYHDFPQPTPVPAGNVLQTAGTVKSLHRITELFEGRRSHGLNASQPVAVVGAEFIPAGKTDPVLAVDLIDDGSIPGLAINSLVGITYEAGSPRTAQIRSATRQFASRNAQGVVLQLAIFGGGILAFFLILIWLGRLLKRVMRGRLNARMNRVPGSDFEQWRQSPDAPDGRAAPR